MAQSDPQVNFRCPAGLKKTLELAAASEGRSLNAEIVHRLIESFKADETITIGPEVDDKVLSDAVDKGLQRFFEAHPDILKTGGGAKP